MSFAAPFIGPAISAVGGLFNSGGGAGMRQQTQNLQGAQGDLSSVFNYAMPTSQAMQTAGTNTTNSGLATTAQGSSTLASPLNYWQKIMSGNRPAVMSTLAPETNAIQQQNDASRRQAAASGTARGGGLAAPMQQQQSDMMTQVNNMLFGARSQAPGQISQIGQTQANIGLNTAQIGQDQISKALQMLGLGNQAEGEIANSSVGAMGPERAASNQTINTLTGAAGNAVKAGYNQFGAYNPNTNTGNPMSLQLPQDMSSGAVSFGGF